MNEFIKLLNQDYELIQYRSKDKEVVFHIQSSKKELVCPFCGSKTMHVHSAYQREIQDLPIQDKQTILLVDTRKFFCEVDEARRLTREGYPIGQIAAMMHHTCKTVQNYLNPSYCVTDGHYNARIPGKLAPL